MQNTPQELVFGSGQPQPNPAPPKRTFNRAQRRAAAKRLALASRGRLKLPAAEIRDLLVIVKSQ